VRLYGLIGWPLGHSFSKKYFSEKFQREGIADAHYELFPLRDVAAKLPALLTQQPDLQGLNVTIPHKESVIALLDDLDETARAVGAVNCIRIRAGRLTGFNTDVVGFEQSLRGQWSGAGVRALVLGTGGASKAVTWVLERLGIPLWVVSRAPSSAGQIGYEALAEHLEATADLRRLVVNTTPLGTFPAVDAMPDFPVNLLKPSDLVYDLVYNPAETLLLRSAQAASACAVKNGLEMLQLQAEAAWEIWQRP
jgi:shikimate dehydrogenase